MRRPRKEILESVLSEHLLFTTGGVRKMPGGDPLLGADLGLDSLDEVEIIVALEDELGCAYLPEGAVAAGARVSEVLAAIDTALGPEAPDGGVLRLTDEQFCARYAPERCDNGDTPRQRHWDDYRDRLAIRKAASEGKCWSAVDGDDGGLIITSGMRAAGAEYYVITAIPVEDPGWVVEVADD